MSAFTTKNGISKVLLGQVIDLPENPSDTSYLQTGTIVTRSAYPLLSATYPHPKLGKVDGTSWTNRTVPNYGWGTMAFGLGTFVVAGDVVGAPYISTSKDGITWTNPVGHSAGVGQVCFSRGRFLLPLVSSTVMAGSDDLGVTWTAVGTLPSSALWALTCAAGNGYVIAIGTNKNNTASNKSAYSSDDGVTWTAVTLPSSSQWSSIAYGNGTFVIVSWTSGTKSAYSPNMGANWYATVLPATTTWGSIVFGNGMFIAVSSSSATSSYAMSEDGVTWSLMTFPSSVGCCSLTFGNGIFVMMPNNSSNTALVSRDGYVWTSVTLPTTSTFYAVAYGNDTFVAASGSSGLGMTSVPSDSSIMQLGQFQEGKYMRVK